MLEIRTAILICIVSLLIQSAGYAYDYQQDCCSMYSQLVADPQFPLYEDKVWNFCIKERQKGKSCQKPDRLFSSGLNQQQYCCVMSYANDVEQSFLKAKYPGFSIADCGLSSCDTLSPISVRATGPTEPDCCEVARYYGTSLDYNYTTNRHAYTNLCRYRALSGCQLSPLPFRKSSGPTDQECCDYTKLPFEQLAYVYWRVAFQPWYYEVCSVRDLSQCKPRVPTDWKTAKSKGKTDAELVQQYVLPVTKELANKMLLHNNTVIRNTQLRLMVRQAPSSESAVKRTLEQPEQPSSKMSECTTTQCLVEEAKRVK